MFRSASRMLLPSVLLMVSGYAFADAVFTDSTFNLTNYTETPAFQRLGTITASQCSSCGDPGFALQVLSTFGDTTSANGEVAQGYLNNGFIYNPATQGPIADIDASVDKDLTINVTLPPPSTFINAFWPLIEQDGNYYVAPFVTGPGFFGGSTGFILISQTGLTYSNFVQFNFATGLSGSAHPNFSGDTMTFGLAQIDALGGYTSGAQENAVFDNLNLDIISTPEPSSLLLVALGLILSVGIGAFRNSSERHPEAV